MEKFGQEVAAPSELQPSSINWGELARKAIELEPSIDGAESERAPAVADVPTLDDVKVAEAQPEVESTKVEEPKVEEPAKAVREFADDDLVKIKVDGEEKVVTYKDYKDGIQREAVFTKRMQTLAQQRQAAEQELAQQYANLYQQAQLLEMERRRVEEANPLTLLAKQLQTKEKAEQDPNTLATIGEIQKALQDHRQQLEQELSTREARQRDEIAQAAAQLRAQTVQAQEAARFTAALNETLSDKDIAVIKTVVPDPQIADAIIRYNVAQMGPETIEEGIEFARTFAKQWADNVKAQQKVEDRQVAAQKARAVIEPPQGSPPAPQAPPKVQSFFKKDGGLDWSALHQKALATFEG